MGPRGCKDDFTSKISGAGGPGAGSSLTFTGRLHFMSSFIIVASETMVIGCALRTARSFYFLVVGIRCVIIRNEPDILWLIVPCHAKNKEK